MAQANRNPDVREARLFRNNKSQAVRIPVDMELPGDRVMIHREGNRLVLVPMKRGGLLEALAGMEPLGPEDAMPDIDDSDLLPLDDVEV
jgi:antitoxin VapB